MPCGLSACAWTVRASGSWAVTPEGIFQFGHSKDHRPDLPQVKVMMSTLDPLGLPLATAVVPGHHADDPLYIPAVRQVRASLGQDRKSTRLNSSHVRISYAVFCLKKKKGQLRRREARGWEEREQGRR